MNTLPDEPRWLSVEEVIAINAAEVALEGEVHFIRSEDLLSSAVMRPRNAWAYMGEEDVSTLATLLAAGIAKNHAFEQGNKRTASTSCLVFLKTNGFEFYHPNNRELGYMIKTMVLGKTCESDFADFLADHLTPI